MLCFVGFNLIKEKDYYIKKSSRCGKTELRGRLRTERVHIYTTVWVTMK